MLHAQTISLHLEMCCILPANHVTNPKCGLGMGTRSEIRGRGRRGAMLWACTLIPIPPPIPAPHTHSHPDGQSVEHVLPTPRSDPKGTAGGGLKSEGELKRSRGDADIGHFGHQTARMQPGRQTDAHKSKQGLSSKAGVGRGDEGGQIQASTRGTWGTREGQHRLNTREGQQQHNTAQPHCHLPTSTHHQASRPGHATQHTQPGIHSASALHTLGDTNMHTHIHTARL